MGEDDAEHGPAVRVPPPVLFLASIAVAVGVHVLLWPSPGVLPGGLGPYVGAAVFLGGLVLMVRTHRPFKETGQDPAPWKPVPSLIRGGPYRYSRNPMYVAAMLMQAGTAIAFDLLWILMAVPALVLALDVLVIRHEEAYLAKKFGDEYRTYCNEVRRWI